MRVYSNPKWPTAQWLKKELEELPGPDIAWGIEYPGAFGGSTKYYGKSQLEKMSEEGVNVPKYIDKQDIIAFLNTLPTGVVVFGRRTNHTQGKDIVKYCNNSWDRTFFDKDYYTVLVPNVVAEWRVFVFRYPSVGHRTIGVGKKTPTSTVLNDLVRSRRNGWVIQFNHPPPKGLRPTAVRATSALGYDFGAVDVLQTEDNTFTVLEVNSAPGLQCPYTRRKWLEAFKSLHSV